MSSDEADFQSSLEDLVSFVELLSPISAQLQGTRIVDSSRRIAFDESQESAISFTGVHTNNTMSDTQDAVNQLKSFFVESSPISEFDFGKN
jgi:hypothetical protein